MNSMHIHVHIPRKHKTVDSLKKTADAGDGPFDAGEKVRGPGGMTGVVVSQSGDTVVVHPDRLRAAVENWKASETFLLRRATRDENPRSLSIIPLGTLRQGLEAIAIRNVGRVVKTQALMQSIGEEYEKLAKKAMNAGASRDEVIKVLAAERARWTSDAAGDRAFPSYTTAQLEAFVASGRGNAAMVQEIADRKSGASQVRVIPQLRGFGKDSAGDFEVTYSDKDYKIVRKVFKNDPQGPAGETERKAYAYAKKLEKDSDGDKYGFIRGRVNVKSIDSAFSSLEGKLAKQGVSDPGGLAYAIGAKKYGAAGMAAKAAAGRKAGDAADSACLKCGGNGWLPNPDTSSLAGTGRKRVDSIVCPTCKGAGKTADDDMDNIAPGYHDPLMEEVLLDAVTRSMEESAGYDAKMKDSLDPVGTTLTATNGRPLTVGQVLRTEEWDRDGRALKVVGIDGKTSQGSQWYKMIVVAVPMTSDAKGRKTGDAAYDAGLFGEEEGLKLGKPVNVEWLRLDHLSPESLSGEADRGGIKAEGKTPQIMALLRKKFSEKQFAAWSQCY
jgi:hypothetical protein